MQLSLQKKLLIDYNMKLLGNTRIYGVKLDDIEKSMSYTLAATVRDLYDTLKEEGDNVTIWIESEGGLTKTDALVKVKSIDKVAMEDDDSIYRLRSLIAGINEEVTGNDAAIYCTGDTKIKSPTGAYDSVPVSLLKHSAHYEVIELDVPNPDLYTITIEQFHNGNIFRNNIFINGVAVMLK